MYRTSTSKCLYFNNKLLGIYGSAYAVTQQCAFERFAKAAKVTGKKEREKKVLSQGSNVDRPVLCGTVCICTWRYLCNALPFVELNLELNSVQNQNRGPE